MPKTWRVNQSTNVNTYLKGNKNIKVGDKIHVNSDAQLGEAMYKVVSVNNNKKKTLKTIYNNYDIMDNFYSYKSDSGSKKKEGSAEDKKEIKNKKD